jgi:Fe-Mn family superoxide dismutase
MPYSLPELPYPYDALEPHLDSQTLEIHHRKHHQTYVDKLNEALATAPEMSKEPIESLLMNLEAVPEAIRVAVRNVGGGHANHSFFWTIMAPKADPEPTGDLASALTGAFGSVAEFKITLTKAATTVFGSGWAWLVKNQAGDLSVMTTQNQGSPLSVGLTPLLAIDVWEHAYYLKYQNKRADYITAWWNVVNWSKVAEIYTK